MSHKKFALKLIAFLLALALCYAMVMHVLTPKYLYDDKWPTTQTFSDFYALEENSIDVLFLGSSHAVSSFSPLQLYRDYGIASYNLGSEEQNLLLSYYWLREALKTQSPQVVVLDTMLLYPYATEEAWNTPETSQRKSVDYMRWSANKMELISTLCAGDENQSALSYYLTNIRFHARWSDLSLQDFTFGLVKNHEALLGYSCLDTACGLLTYCPFETGSSDEIAEVAEAMVTYLDAIVDLCQEKGITLVLCKTPTKLTDITHYNYASAYAKEHGVDYIDYNDITIAVDTIGYDFGADSADVGHVNAKGAVKITDYIGIILTDTYGVEARYSDAHEALLSYYEEVYAAAIAALDDPETIESE